MCGRYTFFTDKELQEVDEIIEKISNEIQQEKMKTGDIFPTNAAPILISEKNLIIPRLFTWGFPNFRDKGVVINARSETIREKKMFASALESRRCIIPSTGFYEWDAKKMKYLFNVPDTGMLYMAGLYNQYEGENRFVILTTDANNSVSDVHKRMPVVVPKEKIEDWIFDLNKGDDILYGTHPDLIKRFA